MDLKYRIRLQNENQRSLLKSTTFITILIVIITIIDITQITKFCYCANLSLENNGKTSTEYSISSSSSSSSPSNLSTSPQQSTTLSENNLNLPSTLSGRLTINSTTTTTEPSSSSSSSSTKHYVPVSHSPKIQKRAGNILSSTDTKIKKAITIRDEHNSDEQEQDDSVIDADDGVSHTREALSQDGSQRDPIVYLSENAGYIPINSLRGRPGILPGSGGIGSYNQQQNHHHHTHHPSPHPQHGPSSSSHSQSIDLDGWVPDQWDREYNRRTRFNASRVQHIEAECQDDYMKIRIGFNGSFTGLLYSAGYAYDPDCMYINGSGRDYYEFFIQLNRCGTLGKNAIHEKSREHPTNFMWNTITVQYNPLIEEEFDEHFKVTCEYGYDFWKTVTFPFLDVEVATGNPVVFTLSPPECYMEIRNGYGAGGTRVTGPVRVGDPLTLMIYMRSKYDGFDIVVNDCYAHNGANKRIQLIDEYGCPVDDKLISRFRGTWSDSGIFETQVYAYMKTFRFTGSPALYIECDVRMCHGRCPSQPCHWRNVKTVTKRDVSNQTNQTTIFDDNNTNYNQETNKTIIENNLNIDMNNNTNKEAALQALSDNISLFQSLQVLQEGENDDENNNNNSNFKKIKESSETCIKTSILSTILGTCCLLVCILSGLVLITCSKLRYRNKDSVLYNAYINHKGQID